MRGFLCLALSILFCSILISGCELDKKDEGVKEGTGGDTGPSGVTWQQACISFANTACSRQLDCGNISDKDKCIADYECGTASNTSTLDSQQENYYKDCLSSLPSADCSQMKEDVGKAVPACEKMFE